MNKFNLDSAKFIAIIVGICFIFIMVVWHAFDYIPAKNSSDTHTQEVVVPSDEEEFRAEEQSTEEEFSEEGKEESAVSEEEIRNNDYDDKMREIELEKQATEQSNSRELKSLEPLDEDTLSKDIALKDEITSREERVFEADPLEEALIKARDAKQNNQMAVAVSEYQKAASLTSDRAQKASCYEEVAMIYAKSKRYGSALSFAQKAYNTAPSTDREVLLARLYFKTGDIDRATTRVNNVLKRDF